jgi:hypothetical protein
VVVAAMLLVIRLQLPRLQRLAIPAHPTLPKFGVGVLGELGRFTQLKQLRLDLHNTQVSNFSSGTSGHLALLVCAHFTAWLRTIPHHTSVLPWHYLQHLDMPACLDPRYLLRYPAAVLSQ